MPAASKRSKRPLTLTDEQRLYPRQRACPAGIKIPAQDRLRALPCAQFRRERKAASR